jgi:glycosyltransferase involved in cell wall biosynthesis
LKDEQKIAIVLLGDGKDKPKLQQEAEEKKLANVLFLPPVPKMEMAEALAGSNVCLAILKPVKLYSTVYPNKVFDYMAAGRPVLLAIDGAIREVIEKAGAGVFVQPGDAAALAAATREMASDPVGAKRMGSAGRGYLEKHFNRVKLADEMEAILVETAAKKQQ